MGLLKKLWLQANIRSAHGSGDLKGMERVYKVRDPWNLTSETEMFRHRATASFIESRLPVPLGSILEVGCGEGAQTRALASMAKKIVGVDPSPEAIERARQQSIANANFVVGDLLGYPVPQDKFDLVTACEVLYYLKDLEEGFHKLGQLGRHALVTYFQGEAERLDRFFNTKVVETTLISHQNQQWRLVFWTVS